YHNKYAINPKLVKDVCKYYEMHGKSKTQKCYPEVNVRSIVERYKLFKPRQVKWKEQEIIQLARFAGVISMQAQAKYFNRPRANAGSIKSVWVKKFRNCGGRIHGMAWYQARHITTPECPVLLTPFWVQRKPGSVKGTAIRKLCLWTDM